MIVIIYDIYLYDCNNNNNNNLHFIVNIPISNPHCIDLGCVLKHAIPKN